MYAGPYKETQTATSYLLTLNQPSSNGGTAKGTFGGPMKDGKRNGTWTAKFTYNLAETEKGTYMTGTVIMTRNYKMGIPDGSYKYDKNLTFRDGTLSHGKWVYGAPEAWHESASGTFSDGKLDGQWTIETPKFGGYKVTLNFKDGKPHGKQRIYDYLEEPTTFTETYDNGMLTGYDVYGNGWEYPKESDLTQLSETYTSDFLNDRNRTLIKGGDFSTYLSYNPIGASSESFEATCSKASNDELKVFYGSDDFIQRETARVSYEKKRKELESLSAEERKIGEKLDRTLKSIRKDYADIYNDLERRCDSKVYEMVAMYEIIKRESDIQSLISNPLFPELGNCSVKKMLEFCSVENQQIELDKLNSFVDKGKEDAQKLFGNVFLEIPEDSIVKFYDPQMEYVCFYMLSDDESNTGCCVLSSRKAMRYKQKMNQREISFDRLNPAPISYRNGVFEKSKSEWTDCLYELFRQSPKLISSTEEISDDDILLYVLYNDLLFVRKEHPGSYKTLTPSYTTVEYKLSKGMTKDATALLTGINKIYSKIPRGTDLGHIVIADIDMNLKSVDKMKGLLENKGILRKAMKHYNKVLKRK